MKKSRGRRLLGRSLAHELTETELLRAFGSQRGSGSICGIDYTPTRDPRTGQEID
jgi:hypothetical protein